MKDLIKKILKEETEEVLIIPSLSIFPDGIEGLKNFIEKKNITRWSFDDKLVLRNYEGDLTWLEGLVSVSGRLDLEAREIDSLPNLKSVGHSLYLTLSPIKSLPNLKSVGFDLDLRGTQIKDLGNLQSVGGDLWLNKFLSEKYTYDEIESIINVGGIIRKPWNI
jgi:hypothetical protein